MKKQYAVPPFILTLIVILGVIVTFTALAPVIFPIDLGATNLIARLAPPSFVEGGSPEYLLGTDHLGRDFAIRLVYATRNSLQIAGGSMVIALLLGTFLGVVAGMYGGILDHFIMFLTDVQMSIPSNIAAIVFASIFGSTKRSMILIIGVTGFASFSRLVRGQIIQLREAHFIECSRSLGASRLRILLEHVLVNVSSPLIVNATLRLSSFILLESSLSFLGLGIQPPDVSLGVMVSAGRDYLISSWWLAIIPSAVIVLIVLIVSLVGDWLRDKLDPKLQNNT